MGTPLPSALAMVTTSGSMPKCWKPNHRPVRPRPVCTSSTIEQDAPLVAEPPDALEVLGGRRVHAALALHRLEQHGGDRRVEGRARARRGRPTPRGGSPRAAAGTPRAWPAGRWRASVASVRPWKRAEGADDDVAAAAAALAGQLDGALVGLGAGVGEEHLAAGRRRAAVEGRRPPRGPTSVPKRFDTCSRVRACSARASATAGWRGRAPVTARPDRKSR